MINLRSLLEDIGNDNGKLFYFAYGSNMDIAKFESKYKTAKALRLAYLPDHQLFFDKFSKKDNSEVADVRTQKGSKVFGILYKIDASEIQSLDDQEGGYLRVQSKIYDANNNVYKAFYYSVIDKSSEQVLPSLSYIRMITIGLKDALQLGPVESKPLKNELKDYIQQIISLANKSKEIEENLDKPVLPNFQKLAITNVKETPTYTKTSVMWNGKLIGYVVFSKEKQKYIAMSDGSREFNSKGFNDEESAINYLKQYSSFTIPITVGGGSEEGSYQSYGY
jgi:hypothetical protein